MFAGLIWAVLKIICFLTDIFMICQKNERRNKNHADFNLTSLYSFSCIDHNRLNHDQLTLPFFSHNFTLTAPRLSNWLRDMNRLLPFLYLACVVLYISAIFCMHAPYFWTVVPAISFYVAWQIDLQCFTLLAAIASHQIIAISINIRHSWYKKWSHSQNCSSLFLFLFLLRISSHLTHFITCGSILAPCWYNSLSC